MGTQERLTAYLRQVKDRPFVWGEHDCFVFSNTAFGLYHGLGYADDWIGKYMQNGKPISAPKLRADLFSGKTFDDEISSRLKEISYAPPRGALCATKKAERWHIGYALGISVGIKAAFLSAQGVIYVPLENVDKAWVPK